MTKDLTEFFLQALEGSMSWRKDGFEDVIKCIRAKPNLSVNWDSTVPEYWVGIEIEGLSVAVIRVDFPLVIVLRQYHEEMSKIFSNVIIKYLLVDNFTDETLSLKQDKIIEIFPDKFSDVIDSGNFSIRQLVYATI